MQSPVVPGDRPAPFAPEPPVVPVPEGQSRVTAYADGDTPIISHIKKLAALPQDAKNIADTFPNGCAGELNDNKNTGQTPLMVAVACGNSVVVEILLSNNVQGIFPSSKVRVPVFDKTKKSALWYAVEYPDSALDVTSDNTTETDQAEMMPRRKILRQLFVQCGGKPEFGCNAEGHFSKLLVHALQHENLYFLHLVIQSMIENESLQKIFVGNILHYLILYAKNPNSELFEYLTTNELCLHHLQFPIHELYVHLDNERITKKQFIKLVSIQSDSRNDFKTIIQFLSQNFGHLTLLEKQNIVIEMMKKIKIQDADFVRRHLTAVCDQLTQGDKEFAKWALDEVLQSPSAPSLESMEGQPRPSVASPAAPTAEKKSTAPAQAHSTSPSAPSSPAALVQDIKDAKSNPAKRTDYEEGDNAIISHIKQLSTVADDKKVAEAIRKIKSEVVDTNKNKWNHKTPFMIAVQCGNPAMVRLLKTREMGFGSKIDANAIDREGRNGLCHAVSYTDLLSDDMKSANDPQQQETLARRALLQEFLPDHELCCKVQRNQFGVHFDPGQSNEPAGFITSRVFNQAFQSKNRFYIHCVIREAVKVSVTRNYSQKTYEAVNVNFLSCLFRDAVTIQFQELYRDVLLKDYFKYLTNLSFDQLRNWYQTKIISKDEYLKLALQSSYKDSKNNKSLSEVIDFLLSADADELTIQEKQQILNFYRRSQLIYFNDEQFIEKLLEKIIDPQVSQENRSFLQWILQNLSNFCGSFLINFTYDLTNRMIEQGDIVRFRVLAEAGRIKNEMIRGDYSYPINDAQKRIHAYLKLLCLFKLYKVKSDHAELKLDIIKMVAEMPKEDVESVMKTAEILKIGDFRHLLQPQPSATAQRVCAEEQPGNPHAVQPADIKDAPAPPKDESDFIAVNPDVYIKNHPEYPQTLEGAEPETVESTEPGTTDQPKELKACDNPTIVAVASATAGYVPHANLFPPVRTRDEVCEGLLLLLGRPEDFSEEEAASYLQLAQILKKLRQPAATEPTSDRDYDDLARKACL